MLRKVWLVVLTVLTVAFIVALAVISISDYKPSVWLSEGDADKLFYQEYLLKIENCDRQ